MKDFFQKIYKHLPHFIHNCLISGFNYITYKLRYSGTYRKHRREYNFLDNISLEELKNKQFLKFQELFEYAKNNSPYYQQLYKDCDLKDFQNIQDIRKIPIISKEEIRNNIDEIITAPKTNLKSSKTGGTTGKSLVVYKTENDIQERMAILDNFRAQFGYELGKKTAWFSGKSLLTQKDIKKKRFWKRDFIHKVKYYSTFHMKPEYMVYYIKDLVKFKPEFLVGFPSTISEIAKFGISKGLDFPSNTIKAVFPTAESVTPYMKNQIETFFKTKVYDQYASSEGAPFIVECPNRNLHLNLLTGVFEVLNDQNKPVKEGKLVCTSFTSYGTPLIRYDIGDGLILSDRSCNCGNNNPLVDEILGRVNDFIYSPETGKINLGNVSNTLKGTEGIIKFQVVQDKLDEIKIYYIVDNVIFVGKYQEVFLKNWRDRVGSQMKINFEIVDELAVEKSGKFRIVKNNVKHLINE